MATTRIQVTAVDNEIILIAIPTGGLASVELFHYSMGYSKPVDVTILPGMVLPTGNYTLSMIGINWGGPSTYSVTVTTDGVAQTYTGGGNATIGPNWVNSVPISIVAGQ